MLQAAMEMRYEEAASANAHYIWYYFAAIGLIAAVALLLFAKITESIDKKKKSSR